jgi:membrane associated rhomboid family serine protease
MTAGGAASPGGVAPQCYRHPGRETWISCARCSRPICPDCMIPAAVGFQCPECVRASPNAQRVVRTTFGGRAVANTSAVTYGLIGLNVLAYLFEISSASIVNRFALVGYGIIAPIGGSQHLIGVAHGEYYRLLTSMFLHEPPSSGGAYFLHILFNMWALYVVGPPLEARLGRIRFLVMYLLAGLAGSAAAYLLSAPNVAVLGASGAIFGLFGALLVIGRHQRLNIQPIAITIVLNLVLSFSIANISWQGHIGGLIGGTALAAAWAYAPRRQRLAIQIASSVALLALIVVVVALRTHNLTH